MEEVDNFLLCLSYTKVQPSLDDKVIWGEEKNGQSATKSLFKVLESATFFFSSKQYMEMLWQIGNFCVKKMKKQ